MTSEKDLLPDEERRLGRVLDAWQVSPASQRLKLSIMAAARPRQPAFHWTRSRIVTLAAAACLGLIVGWADTGESQATSYDTSADALFFPGDAIEGDIL